MEILKIGLGDFGLAVKKAVWIIKKGGVLVCPTDTVYGLVGDASNQEAVEKIFLIKQRQQKPIPIFVRDIASAKKFAFINKEQEVFLRKVWPGKVTVVLKRKKTVLPVLLFGKRKTIGLRIPNYILIEALLKKPKRPLTGTSANISGKPASTHIKKVMKQFAGRKNQPDLVLDGGILPKSSSSKVVDITKNKPKILR